MGHADAELCTGAVRFQDRVIGRRDAVGPAVEDEHHPLVRLAHVHPAGTDRDVAVAVAVQVAGTAHRYAELRARHARQAHVGEGDLRVEAGGDGIHGDRIDGIAVIHHQRKGPRVHVQFHPCRQHLVTGIENVEVRICVHRRSSGVGEDHSGTIQRPRHQVALPAHAHHQVTGACGWCEHQEVLPDAVAGVEVVHVHGGAGPREAALMGAWFSGGPRGVRAVRPTQVRDLEPGAPGGRVRRIAQGEAPRVDQRLEAVREVGGHEPVRGAGREYPRHVLVDVPEHIIAHRRRVLGRKGRGHAPDQACGQQHADHVPPGH